MKSIELELAGQKIEIVCQEAEADKIRNLGAKVNDKIKELQKTYHNIPLLKLFFLVSLGLQDQIDHLNGEIIELTKNNIVKNSSAVTKELQKENAELLDMVTRMLGKLNDASTKFEELSKNKGKNSNKDTI